MWQQKEEEEKEGGECCPHAGGLKWRSVLKQSSLAKAHHSPVTAGRFTEARGKIIVHLPQMLSGERPGFISPQTKHKTIRATLRAVCNVPLVHQKGEKITVTY